MVRTGQRGVIGVLLTVALVLSCAGLSRVGGATTLVVTGYIEQGASPAMIQRSAGALNTVGIDGINLVSAGNRTSTPDASMLALLSASHVEGLRGELLVGNFDNTINDFSTKIAHALLHSVNNMTSVARQLSQLVQGEKWDGITIDLESLSASDSAGLVAFMTQLRSALPTQCSLSIDVQASTTLAGYEASGYDLARLAQVADRVVLMAYDQHGPWSGPGPIGALDWQRRALKVLLTQVSPSKVDLGVAGYGYTWPKGSKLHEGNSISDSLARRLVQRNHVRAHWVSSSGEWTARLKNGTELWWADARSYALRVALATSMQVHGLALWQLASADPLKRQ